MAVLKMCVWKISKEIDEGVATFICHREVVLRGCIKLFIYEKQVFFIVSGENYVFFFI